MKKLLFFIIILSCFACEQESRQSLYAKQIANSIGMEFHALKFEIKDEVQHTEAAATIGQFNPQELEIYAYVRGLDSLSIKQGIFHELGHYIFYKNLDYSKSHTKSSEIFSEMFANSFLMGQDSALVHAEKWYSTVKGVYERVPQYGKSEYNSDNLELFLEYVMSTEKYGNLKLIHERY